MVIFKPLLNEIFLDMAKLLSEIKSFCPHKSSYSYHASITLTNNRKVEDINEKNDKVIQTKKCVLSLKLNDSESKNNVSSDKLNLHLRKNSVASVGSIKVTPRSQENKNLIINRHLRSNSIASANFSTTNAKIKKNFKEITVNPKNMETEKSEFKEKKEQKQTLASANITPLSKDVVVDYRELDLKLQIDNIVKHGKNIHRSYQKF